MSGNSNVGSGGVYEAGDQRNAPESEQNQATPYEEGKENAHDQNDPSMTSANASLCHKLTEDRGRAFHRQPLSCGQTSER
jgi:hypothetical protein